MTAGKPPERLGCKVAYMVTEQRKDVKVPLDYKDAVNGNDITTWGNAMERMNSLNASNTWDLVWISPGRRL